MKVQKKPDCDWKTDLVRLLLQSCISVVRRMEIVEINVRVITFVVCASLTLCMGGTLQHLPLILKSTSFCSEISMQVYLATLPNHCKAFI